jgi:hypothetical protein
VAKPAVAGLHLLPPQLVLDHLLVVANVRLALKLAEARHAAHRGSILTRAILQAQNDHDPPFSGPLPVRIKAGFYRKTNAPPDPSSQLRLRGFTRVTRRSQ